MDSSDSVDRDGGSVRDEVPSGSTGKENKEEQEQTEHIFARVRDKDEAEFRALDCIKDIVSEGRV